MDCRRVVVTGMGIVSPLGSDLTSFWENLSAGNGGIKPLTKLERLEEYSSRIGGEVQGLQLDKFFSRKELRKTDPFSQYGLAAAEMAIEDSGLELKNIEQQQRAGAIVSSGVGGLRELQNQNKVYQKRGPSRFSPFMIPKMITNIIAGQIAIKHGLRGPNFCVTSACASATHSIGEAMRIIQHNEADIMVTGGTEAPMNALGVGGFCAMRALSTRNEEPEKASRPFDKERDGFLIAEGSGIIVLEDYEHARKRGAHIYCELGGYGRTCDAHHITAPDSEAVEASRSMKLAIEDAGLNSEDLDYVNAHGTSTPLNDKTETLAVKKSLGEENARKVMISSSKSMTGHMLGAAGGAESIACALMLENGVVTPTINYENPDPECDLDYVPNEAREADIKSALSNSLGFGGHNGTLVFKKI